MIPLLTALFAALTEACKAYVARLAWDQFNADARTSWMTWTTASR